MEIRPLLRDLQAGYWAMSFSGINAWAPVVHKIMSGVKFDLGIARGDLMTIFDSANQRVRPDRDGVYTDIPYGSVAVVNLEGPMLRVGTICQYGTDDVVSAMKWANEQREIVAILLYVNSPGGSVASVPPFREFAQNKKKPVLGYYEQALSAGLFAMTECCDYIMAENDITAMIGSVGVVFTMQDASKHMADLGFVIHEVYADENEHKNQAFILARQGDYAAIKKEFLSPMAISFQDSVRAGRPRLNESVEGVLTGKTFFSNTAIEVGLTDSVGSFTQALDRARVLSELSLI